MTVHICSVTLWHLPHIYMSIICTHLVLKSRRHHKRPCFKICKFTFCCFADELFSGVQSLAHVHVELFCFLIIFTWIMVYKSLPGFPSWYNSLKTKHKTKLSSITKQAGKMIGPPQTSFTELYITIYLSGKYFTVTTSFISLNFSVTIMQLNTHTKLWLCPLPSLFHFYRWPQSTCNFSTSYSFRLACYFLYIVFFNIILLKTNLPIHKLCYLA